MRVVRFDVQFERIIGVARQWVDASAADSLVILLDDPTVHADAERTFALLDALHEVSATRQVVLFTQEDDVRCWAQRALAEPRDRLVELDVLAVVSR